MIVDSVRYFSKIEISEWNWTGKLKWLRKKQKQQQLRFFLISDDRHVSRFG